MQTYDIKPGTAAKRDLREIFEAAFGECREEGDWMCASYGSMPKIRVRQEGKKELVVDTETDKAMAVRMANGDEEATRVAVDTHQRWNDFLEGATGYNAKQRSKKAQEKAKKGG